MAVIAASLGYNSASMRTTNTMANAIQRHLIAAFLLSMRSISGARIQVLRGWDSFAGVTARAGP
jgi:hypothetical protein